MPKAIPLRNDYSADELRVLARDAHDSNQARRLLALAGVREGLSRAEAARLGVHRSVFVTVGISGSRAIGPVFGS